jgi:hypothetical protein
MSDTATFFLAWGLAGWVPTIAIVLCSPLADREMSSRQTIVLILALWLVAPLTLLWALGLGIREIVRGVGEWKAVLFPRPVTTCASCCAKWSPLDYLTCPRCAEVARQRKLEAASVDPFIVAALREVETIAPDDPPNA